MQAYVYKRPTTLRKRKEHSHEPDARVVEPNMDATGMELHKDSKYKINFYLLSNANPSSLMFKILPELAKFQRKQSVRQ